MGLSKNQKEMVVIANSNDVIVFWSITPIQQ